MLTSRRAFDGSSTALLVMFATASFATALDVFVVNVALRSVGMDIGDRSLRSLSWVLNAYAIVFAAL